MKVAIAATLFFSLVCSGNLFAEEPELVRVYCFSADLEAGFKDSGANYFCRELGKTGEKKGSVVLTKERALADALVEYLGKEAISTKGETTYLLGGYAWTPDQFKNGVRAVITIDDFSKGFYGEGVNDSAAHSVWTQVETWIRENRAAILEKANEQK